jgi:hypothetical protein
MTISRATAVCGAAFAAALTVLYWFDPATTAVFPACPFRALTGLLCPLCGGLRAAHALLHGRLLDAVALNPFLFAAALAGPLVPRRWTLAAAALFMAVRNIG